MILFIKVKNSRLKQKREFLTMKFYAHYESRLKILKTAYFFILTTAVVIVLYSMNIITIHVVWRHILGTGKVKSFPMIIRLYIDAQMFNYIQLITSIIEKIR